MNEKAAMCPGGGRRWRPGMGRAICPACHRSARSLGVTIARAPVQWKLLAGKFVPEHPARTFGTK